MTHKVWFHILLNCGCILDTCRQPFSYHDGHSTSNVLWLNNSSCLNQLYYIAASVPLGLKSLGIYGISGRTSRRRSLSLGESSKNGLQQSQGAGGWRRLEGLYVLGVWPIVVLRPYKQTPILSVQNVSIQKKNSGTTFFWDFKMFILKNQNPIQESNGSLIGNDGGIQDRKMEGESCLVKSWVEGFPHQVPAVNVGCLLVWFGKSKQLVKRCLEG